MKAEKLVKQPDSVEKVFCKPFDKVITEQMDKETTEMMFKLMNISKYGSNIEIKEKDKPFEIRLIEKALQTRFTFKLEDPTLILFIATIGGSAGKIIMYLTYIQYRLKQLDERVLTWDIFAMSIFSHGFPKEEEMHRLWDAQKVRIKGSSFDNLLDYIKATESIQFIPEKSDTDA